MTSSNIGEAARDMRGAANYLHTRDHVQPKKTGILGFCMGGQLALYAAIEFPEQFSAGVDFYGIHHNAQIDPSRLQVPVLAHFAKRDNNVPEENARAQKSTTPQQPHLHGHPHTRFPEATPAVALSCVQECHSKTSY